MFLQVELNALGFRKACQVKRMFLQRRVVGIDSPGVFPVNSARRSQGFPEDGYTGVKRPVIDIEPDIYVGRIVILACRPRTFQPHCMDVFGFRDLWGNFVNDIIERHATIPSERTQLP